MKQKSKPRHCCICVTLAFFPSFSFLFGSHVASIHLFIHLSFLSIKAYHTHSVGLYHLYAHRLCVQVGSNNKRRRVHLLLNKRGTYYTTRTNIYKHEHMAHTTYHTAHIHIIQTIHINNSFIQFIQYTLISSQRYDSQGW